MKRLRTVIFQRIVVVAGIGFLLSTAFTYYYYRVILVDQMISEDSARLNQTVRQLEYMSEDIARFAFTLIISETVQSFYKTYRELDTFAQFALFQKTSNYLDDYAGLRKEVSSFGLVLADGQAFWSLAGYDAYFATLLKQPWYTNYIRSGKQQAFTEPHRMYVTKNTNVEGTVISFIVAVRDIEQPAKRIGYFILHLDYTHFENLLDFGSEGFGGLVWMNDAGSVLYERKQPGPETGLAQLMSAASAERGGALPLAGGYALIDRFENNHWRLGAYIPQHSLISRGKIVIYLLGFFSLVNTALILLLMMPAILRMTRPIMRLYHAMNAVSSGNLQTSVRIRTGDELEKLGQGFNRMTNQLRIHLEESIRQEKNKRELELELLLSQLNPHFVYNTLNAVIYLAGKRQTDNIIHMVGAFIRVLQDAARAGDAHALVPLRDELALLRDYIAIQSYRYADMFDVAWEVDEEALDCLVPRNLVQPFVENAIFHGICPRDEDGGLIRIAATAARDTLLIRIEDNGIGIDPEELPHIWVKQEKKPGSGLRHIGLANTRRRVEHLFGDRAELRIASAPGQGTAVVISLPRLNDGIDAPYAAANSG